MIARQGFDVCQRPVPDRDGLGALHVRVARHGCSGVLIRLVHEVGEHGNGRGEQFTAHVAQVDAEVRRDLVVARTAGVDALGKVAAPFAEFALDVAMNIFGVVVVRDPVRADVRRQVVDRGVHFGHVVWLQHGRAAERAGPGSIGLEVGEHEHAIDGQALLELGEERVELAGESSTPHFARFAHRTWPSVVPLPCTREATAPGRP